MNTGNRAVYYARVSTEEEAQLKALPKQVEECKDIIKAKDWVLIKGYVDEGKTGTTANRKEYQKLLTDIEGDEFDIVVAKSQDRLQRNPGDWYIFIDKLVHNNKRLYLYLDGKFFDPSEDALLSGIKAILAAEYSRDLSRKINNANQRRIEKVRSGEKVPSMGNGMIYGYYVENGDEKIDPKQAEIVRLIYSKYLEGWGMRKIVDYLNENGYRNQRGNYFNADTIARILKNPKYKGALVVNRYHRDFDTKKVEKIPPEEWVTLEGAYEAIVSVDEWNEVHKRLESKRGKTRGKKVSTDILGGKIFCSRCGKKLWRHKSNDYFGWYCSTKMQRGKVACEGTAISQLKIDQAYKAIGSNFEINRDVVKQSITEWLKSLSERLNSDKGNVYQESEKTRLKKEIERLVDKYIEGKIPESIYDKKYEELNAQLKALEAVDYTENEDLQAVKEILDNIDTEVDKWIASNDFETHRIDWLKEHTERITITPEKVIIIELDLIAGAILAGKDFILYVMDSMPFTEQTVEGYKVIVKIAA